MVKSIPCCYILSDSPKAFCFQTRQGYSIITPSVHSQPCIQLHGIFVLFEAILPFSVWPVECNGNCHVSFFKEEISWEEGRDVSQPAQDLSTNEITKTCRDLTFCIYLFIYFLLKAGAFSIHLLMEIKNHRNGTSVSPPPPTPLLPMLCIFFPFLTYHGKSYEF